MKALRSALGEECSNDLTAMDRGAILDAHYPTRHVAPQMREQDHHVRRIDGAILAVDVQLTRRNSRTDSGEVIAGAPSPQDGRLADWGRGADHAGQGIEAGCIDADDRLPRGFRPFLMAGHVSSCHWAMAAASRWRAQRAGVCGRRRLAWH
jgi:hypothetical protein